MTQEHKNMLFFFGVLAFWLAAAVLAALWH